jgi:hypothetical protein
MAFRHASPSEKIDGLLTLRQEQPRAVTRHRDAEKVVKVTKIRHGELKVEVCCD